MCSSIVHCGVVLYGASKCKNFFASSFCSVALVTVACASVQCGIVVFDAEWEGVNLAFLASNLVLCGSVRLRIAVSAVVRSKELYCSSL